MKFLSTNLKRPAKQDPPLPHQIPKPISTPIDQRDDICSCHHLKWWHDENGCQTYNCKCTRDYNIRKPPQARTKRIVL